MKTEGACPYYDFIERVLKKHTNLQNKRSKEEAAQETMKEIKKISQLIREVKLDCLTID